MNGFLGFNLTPQAIEKVLSLFPPKFKIIQCHHITYKFNVPTDEFIPEFYQATVTGYASSSRVECLVVEINGETHAPDGRRYHLTLSHVEEAQPFESNIVLAEFGFIPIEPFLIDVVPAFNPFPR